MAEPVHRVPFSRRAIVAGAGAGAAAIGLGALAGCASTETSTPSGSADPSAAPAPTGPVGSTSEVPVGSAKIFAAQQVVVTQAQAGTFAGYSTVCPHQGCAVATVTGASIVCPCHGSAFALDGSVITGPAKRGLNPRDVTVDGEQISVS